ncbi:MAG: arginine repressor [Gemmatimonadota bacterium]|nr:arginine repressor [Gemmatimonadota bacterium]MDE3126363.1 arginine repressor [Gemmatimonadota bacterium]MDE3173923.1 arginine repressor [Gemmatimonadota bacterium]MDE3214758.1 arginine repressor [Gemmatimonadota bacterium]
MANKSARQAAILEIIGAQVIGSQEELRHRLARRGVAVTQATLSRDLRELGLVRVPTADGARYLRQEAISDEAKPSLEALLPQLFSSVAGVSELVVLQTVASGAQPISEAIDAEAWPEVLGTVAGENTILIVCRSTAARKAVVARLTRLARPG